MDARTTLNVKETFIEILKDSHRSDTRVYLLVDDDGLVRAEGFIDVIDTESSDPFIELDNRLKVPLQKIVAVNGLFLPEYAEC